MSEEENQRKITEAINKNGNNFHLDVADELKRLGWKVLISPHYTDFVENIPREIDIVAEKEFPANNVYDGKAGFIVIRLIIETKYILDPHFIWFDNVDSVKKEKFLESKYKFDAKNKPYQKETRYSSVLEVGKLSGTTTSGRGINEVQNALRQVLHSSIVLGRIRPELSNVPRVDRLQMIESYTFPLILLNSFQNIFRVNRKMTPNHSLITDRSFVFESNYTYQNNGQNAYEYFLVEFVDFSQLEGFLQDMERQDLPFIKAVSDEQLYQNSRARSMYSQADSNFDPYQSF